MGDFGSGTEFLFRPYPYGREPFLLTTNELVAYEARFFSLIYFALVNDIRLFTDESSHPVSSPFKLYINKDTALSSSVEPTLGGSGFETATPHYSEVILDAREALDDVFDGHASDSQHVANAFRISHLTRNRLPYVGTSADGVPFDEFVHPEPVVTVPSGTTPPGSSGSIPPPGDGYELGAKQFQDIDMDEVMWQPFVRPGKFATATTKTIPTSPIFPAVLKSDGSLPDFSALDDSTYDELGLGASESGGILITGDALLAGSSIKLIRNSGHSPVSAPGTFIENVPWALFPAARELCRYGGNQYDPALATTSASGRQAIYNTPTPADGDGVYLLAASDESEASGFSIQHYPANQVFTGIQDRVLPVIDTTLQGVHVTDKLIYNLREMAGGQPTVGRSPHNGKRVFAHHAGTDVSSRGIAVPGTIVYANGDIIHGYGGVTVPLFSVANQSSRFEWYNTNKTMSPVNWSERTTTALQPFIGLFGARPSVNYDVADINFAEDDGVVTLMKYAQWGFIDRMICPSQDEADGGERQEDTITSLTLEYRQGPGATWILVGQSTTKRTVTSFRNTYNVNNVFSFFFDRRFNNGIINAGGKLYVQFSNKSGGSSVPPFNTNFARAIGPRTDVLVPAASRTDSIVSIGFFPSWKLIRYVTTNNQVRIPSTMLVTGTGSSITFAGGLGVTPADVNTYGPPAWDSDAGVNYIYFSTLTAAPAAIASRVFFAKMDTDFEIFEINQVETADAILFGRSACISI